MTSTFTEIDDNLEEAARYIAMTIGITLEDVLKANCYTFFRDLNRAKEINKERKKKADGTRH